MTDDEDKGLQFNRDALEILKSVETLDDLKEKREEYLNTMENALKHSVEDLKEAMKDNPEEGMLMMFQDGTDERKQLENAQDTELTRISEMEGGKEYTEALAAELAVRNMPYAEQLVAIMGDSMGALVGGLGDAMVGAFGDMAGGEIEEGALKPSEVIQQGIAEAISGGPEFDLEGALNDEDDTIKQSAMSIKKFREITDSERFKEKTQAALDHMMESIVIGTERIKGIIAMPLEEKRQALQKQKENSEKNEAFLIAMEQEMGRFSALEGVGMADIMFMVQSMEARGEPLTDEMTNQLKELLVSMGGDDGVPSDEDYKLVYDAYAEIVGGDPLIAIQCELKGEEPPAAPQEDVFCLDCGLRQADSNAQTCPECGTEYGKEPETCACAACGALKLVGSPCVLCGGEEDKELPPGCEKCGMRMEDGSTEKICDSCKEEKSET